MALHSSRRTQDQNLNIHFDGVKTNGSIAQKNRGGLGRRKALSDLSNSVKPAQQAQQGIKKRSKGTQTETVVAEDESKKNNSGKPSALNDISNFGKPNKRTQGKKRTNGSIAQKNSQIRVSNSVKPAQQAQQGIKKRSKGKQTETVVAEDESKKNNSGKPSALNDISNFGKPNKRTQGKKRTNGSIAQKNSQIRVSGRKALSDLTNSVKPKKRTQGQQTVTVVAEDENFPCSIAEEGFLHNHDECIQSQKKSMDLDQFLDINGRLDEDVCFQSISGQSKEENPNLWPTSPIFFSKMEEETPELIIRHPRRPRLSQTSPICDSPNSPWPWKSCEYQITLKCMV